MVTNIEEVEAEVPAYPMARQCPYDPPREMSELRADSPVTRVKIWDGSSPWLVTRYDDVREVLADRRFSADFRHPGYPGASAAVKASRDNSPWFVNIDDPDHARYRRMLTAEFAVKRVAGYRPMIESAVDELLDAMADLAQPVDLVQAFALALPSIVICEIMGIPYEDRESWQEQSRILFDVSSSPEEGARADAELRRYLAQILEAKALEPSDDLLGHLAQRYISNGELSAVDGAAMALLLLVAGHETTANMIGLGTMMLLDHPAQAAEVRDGDDKTVQGAVEELLRILTVVQSGRRRVATEDVELGDVRIRAGDGVIASEPAANRDPVRYQDPDRLDIHRSENHHLAFGFGVHRCLGQPLARLELQIAIPALLRRFPDLAVAVPADELTYRDSMIVYGVDELPVRWGASR